MKQHKIMRALSGIGGAALLAMLSMPASALTWQAGDWEVSYTGFVNLFATVSEEGAGGETDSFTFNEGLLPNFHTMKAQSPMINGLRGSSTITFAVDSNDPKTGALNKETGTPQQGGGNIDLREVFFNVEGSFGTISVGRTLSLFQRQAILKDMTLFGVGANGGNNGGNGTSLGRIGFGYVYPDFNTRVAWKLPTTAGISAEFGVFQPKMIAGTDFDTEAPQFQAEVTYNTEYQGGTFGLWAGGLYQTLSGRNGNDDIDMLGYNFGFDIGYAGFNFVGHYYGGDALGVLTPASGLSGAGVEPAAYVGSEEASNDGYYGQVTYTFNGVTKVGVSYGESNQDLDAANGIVEANNTLFTVGVYHDVNSWLKLVAEYNISDSITLQALEEKTFSVGGFIFW